MTTTQPTTAGTRQDYETPQELIDAVEGRFGRLSFDLAAHAQNRKCLRYYGPESSLGTDSLAKDWTQLKGTLWLNPPYKDIAPWAKKAAESLAAVQADAHRRDCHDWRLLLLTPASIGTHWFAQHVHRKALVIALRPRIKFVGTESTDLRDYIISVYGLRPDFSCWSWR